LASGLCLMLDDKPILQDIHLEIPTGRTVAMLGANGAGKSTLLRVLAMLTHPSRGTLSLFGSRVTTDAVTLRSRIGVISHLPMLYRDLTPRENLELFGRLYDLNEPHGRAEDLLGTVGMTPRADDPVKTLSRGMIQRVAIARALMHDPDLLLADEPFDGLDNPSARALQQLLGRLREQGKTLILVNHDIQHSLDISDHVIVLRRGRVVMDKPTSDTTLASVLKEMTGE